MRIIASALLACATLAAPAHATTTVNGALNANAIADYRFSFSGGAFSVAVKSAGSSPIFDPYTLLFADDGSPLTAKTGALVAVNDDYEDINSFISLSNLAAGNYILTVQRCCFGTEFARAGGSPNYPTLVGRTFQAVLSDGATLQNTSAVPEPATWATMLIGLGLIGWSIRRVKQVATVNFA